MTSDYGRFWRDVRLAEGLTQEDVAKIVRTSPPFVSAVERGIRRFSLQQTLRLIRNLDLNPEEIIALLLADQTEELRKVFRKSCGPE